MILKVIGLVYLVIVAICIPTLIYEFKHAIQIDPKAKFFHDDFME